MTLLRLIKLCVLVAVPVLGAVYAYQFMSQDAETQKAVPFKTFKAPGTQVFSALDPNGVKVDLSFKTPITLVNYWATWCPPCVEEFPAMIELRRQLSGKGISFAFISIDDSWEKVEAFLGENVIDVPAEEMFWDPDQSAATAWGSEKFPESFVVRSDSWVVEKIIGQQSWTRSSVVEYFTELGSKFLDLNALISYSVFPNAYAQTVIHEKDRKTLETLRKNVETADKNLREADAALKSEKRSVSEQQAIVKKAERDTEEAQKELNKYKAKLSELSNLRQKYETSLRVEIQERENIKKQILNSQENVKRLEQELEDLRDSLSQLQKTLNTRRENVETSEEALESTNEELASFNDKARGALDLVNEVELQEKKAKSTLVDRNRSVAQLKIKINKLKQELVEQKNNLVESEKIINK